MLSITITGPARSRNHAARFRDRVRPACLSVARAHCHGRSVVEHYDDLPCARTEPAQLGTYQRQREPDPDRERQCQREPPAPSGRKLADAARGLLPDQSRSHDTPDLSRLQQMDCDDGCGDQADQQQPERRRCLQHGDHVRPARYGSLPAAARCSASRRWRVNVYRLTASRYSSGDCWPLSTDSAADDELEITA